MRYFIERSLNYFLLLFGVLLTLSLVRSISAISGGNRKIEATLKKIEETKKEREALKEKIREVQSELFIEKEARDKLGLAKEGEIVVVLPDPEKVRLLAPKEEEEEIALPDPNWKKWLNLFF